MSSPLRVDRHLVSPRTHMPHRCSDLLAGRLVAWDPINCNHGPDGPAIAEAFLCRAHDTDGCRFCHLSCDGFEVNEQQTLFVSLFVCFRLGSLLGFLILFHFFFNIYIWGRRGGVQSR